ncbi:MAG: peptidyl-prolyl cis-trans isomerase [Phycisphaeraceae bacterium]|nr:peptidyl-prolyl cis-trans isomerase [Phycisphaeraceae bacterium]
MPRIFLLIPLLVGLTLVACSSDRSALNASSPATGPTASTGGAAVILSGRTISWSELQVPLVEAAGGPVLVEVILDHLLAQRLSEHALTITPEQIEAEKQIVLSELSPNADQAQTLLNQVRQQRGLGPDRFSRLLRRNAAMRLLVQDQVQVPESLIRQAYEFEYGPRYVARLITVQSLADAAEARRRIDAGEPFMDVAIAMSTDASAAQGGLLPAISPLDPTFPAAVRQVLAKLEVGQVSDPLALGTGMALLKLERKIDAQKVNFDDVKDRMTLVARRRVERNLMEQLAAGLIRDSQVLVLDPALQKAWNQQLQSLQTTSP